MSLVSQTVGSLPLVHYPSAIGQASFELSVLLSAVIGVRQFTINGTGKREAKWNLL
jgi:hypothetical protein